MPATRLLVVADPKMLPALANGLREGGRFEVVPVSIADAAAAAAAVQRAEAVALFYGAPGKPLASAVQALSPAVRTRAGRVVAVLQRDQAAQRDECFRAGASDVLFMPMPKEQFVARLHESVSLAYAEGPGRAANVDVSANGSSLRLSAATVTGAGVQAADELPLESGDTVRLSFAGLQLWGLVVSAGPEARIRFAGVSPDDDARLREWLRSSSPAKPAPARTPPPVVPAPVRPPPAPKGAIAAARPAPAGDADAASRAAPVSGPPPGFASRPREPANPRPGPGKPPPTPASAASRAVPPPPPARGSVAPPPFPGLVSAPRVASASPSRPPTPAAALDELFDEGVAPAEEAQPPPPQLGPPWPSALSAEMCRAALLPLLRGEKNLPGDTPPDIAAAARKIAQVLSLAERTGIEKTGPGSHYGDGATARVALEAARAEGARLAAANPPATVDDAAVKTVVQIADAAAARLQKEADAAIVKGEVETLQSLKAASAALSRDLFSFKEVADRLRGIGAAPRLGAGGLDPEVVLPGQQQPVSRPQQKVETPQLRPELKDFAAFHEKPAEARKRTALFFAFLVLAASVTNFVLNNPRVRDISRDRLPAGVSRIELSGSGARVTVSRAFLEKPGDAANKLIELLRERKIDAAALFNDAGAIAGQIDVKAGKIFTLGARKAPPAPGAATAASK